MIRPSAQEPAQRAVSALTAAAYTGGGTAGRVHSRARSTSTNPRWLTHSPAKSARITSTDSRSRALRSDLVGHRWPVMCSLTAWPLPSASQNRPGNISASVAAACATIAGWYRCPGALTTPNGRLVRASAAPSQDQAKPDCPCSEPKGAK